MAPARTSTAWALAALATATLLAGCLQAPAPSPPEDVLQAPLSAPRADLQAEGARAPTPWPAGIHAFNLTVEGQDATGLLAVPDGKPGTLVVVAHGWGADAAFHRQDLEMLAAEGALAVAMDYRGPRSAFKLSAGVEDTVAATLLLQEAYPGLARTLLYGWSMGGEVALLAPLAAPPGTYDYVFAGAGVMDLEMLWRENPLARADVEHETGGTPFEVPNAYAERSPLPRAQDLAGRGISRVFLLHGAADGVVPIEHSERMYEALQAAGVPVSYYVVTRDRSVVCSPFSCQELATPADHFAGRMQPMWPFLAERIAGAADPAEPFLRGTYDAYAGTYEPKGT